jgi:hypothetical protein
MKQWLPKEHRKKILFLSDDMRIHSGIGVMSREIVEQTCGVFNWVQVGAAVNHPEAGQVVDISEDMSQVTGVNDPSVRIYPNNGYGDSRLVRRLLEIEAPDAMMIFTDPRYWVWLFQIEHEIRQKIPLMYYNIWDGGWSSSANAMPRYNRNYYRSCDALFSISKQTYAVNKYVLGPDNIIESDAPVNINQVGSVLEKQL